MKDEPLEKYWVYEAGLKDLGIICLEENLYPWAGEQSWDKEAV